MPTILPQLTMMISVCLLFLMKGMTCLTRLVLSRELVKEEEDSLVGVLLSSTICFFNLKRRQIVTIVASVPKTAMIPFRWLMRSWV
jgi:hypothetical protein